MAANSGRAGWGFRLQERHRPGVETEQSFAGYMTGGDDGLTMLNPVEVDAELADWKKRAKEAEQQREVPSPVQGDDDHPF